MKNDFPVMPLRAMYADKSAEGKDLNKVGGIAPIVVEEWTRPLLMEVINHGVFTFEGKTYFVTNVNHNSEEDWYTIDASSLADGRKIYSIQVYTDGPGETDVDYDESDIEIPLTATRLFLHAIEIPMTITIDDTPYEITTTVKVVSNTNNPPTRARETTTQLGVYYAEGSGYYIIAYDEQIIVQGLPSGSQQVNIMGAQQELRKVRFNKTGASYTTEFSRTFRDTVTLL